MADPDQARLFEERLSQVESKRTQQSRKYVGVHRVVEGAFPGPRATHEREQAYIGNQKQAREQDPVMGKPVAVSNAARAQNKKAFNAKEDGGAKEKQLLSHDLQCKSWLQERSRLTM